MPFLHVGLQLHHTQQPEQLLVFSGVDNSCVFSSVLFSVCLPLLPSRAVPGEQTLFLSSSFWDKALLGPWALLLRPAGRAGGSGAPVTPAPPLRLAHSWAFGGARAPGVLEKGR